MSKLFEAAEEVQRRWNDALIYTPDTREKIDASGNVIRVRSENWRPVDVIHQEWLDTGHIYDDCDASRIARRWLPDFGGTLDGAELFVAQIARLGGAGHLFVTVQHEGLRWTLCDTVACDMYPLRDVYDPADLRLVRPLGGGKDDWEVIEAR